MRIFQPPQQIQYNPHTTKIFLAGTIDMGNSENWQSQTYEFLENRFSFVDVYNPRREDWDSSWKQTSEDPQFYQQVNWELDAMNKSDIIIMNFLATSQSPITLLELGLYAKSEKLLVCCPDEYWRSGNVNIVCNNYNIRLFKDMKSLLKAI